MEGGVINSFVSTTISGSTFFENYSDNHGGVMTVRNAPLTVSNSKFTSNYSLDGGAINVRHSGDCCNVTISGSTFTNNFGFRFITRGGAIYIERGWASSSIVRITDSYFDNIRASTGGALYSRKVDMTIERSSFHNNTAHDLGAAIYRDAHANPGTMLTVNNTTFYNNNRGTYHTATIYIITGATNWGRQRHQAQSCYLLQRCFEESSPRHRARP